ncbi:uncharacterized protein LOC133380604 isoform X3 [Rhineura floridana]|uniref:uncharacterized protein LOC133380604 isoform X3 n=1 Tax=Rhineura floridana TaxID=261503 RepID=UPI002AC7F608|nr:uncharacterized protein LOC133380604 isoform X3 [Rhineura floridana]
MATSGEETRPGDVWKLLRAAAASSAPASSDGHVLLLLWQAEGSPAARLRLQAGLVHAALRQACQKGRSDGRSSCRLPGLRPAGKARVFSGEGSSRRTNKGAQQLQPPLWEPSCIFT